MSVATRLLERRIERIITTPAPQPGFIGEGHEAVPVVPPGDFARTDPFIALMDDRVDLAPGRRAGEAHPHAGFDVVTFVKCGNPARAPTTPKVRNAVPTPSTTNANRRLCRTYRPFTVSNSGRLPKWQRKHIQAPASRLGSVCLDDDLRWKR